LPAEYREVLVSELEQLRTVRQANIASTGRAGNSRKPYWTARPFLHCDVRSIAGVRRIVGGAMPLQLASRAAPVLLTAAGRTDIDFEYSGASLFRR